MGRATRRQFIKKAVLATGLWASGCVRQRFTSRPISACEKLNIGGIGVGGKGASDIKATSRGQNVVALCDVDEHRLAEAAKLYPSAKCYTDWRRLLDQKGIDAVTISTPDHMHAPIAMSAIERGIHVYVQKPLTLTVYEARQLARHARMHKVVTQMGNQGHSSSGMRTLVKVIQDGVIGKIKEAHVWTDRPIWPQDIPRPSGNDPVPSWLHWDLWLGVAPYRPYVGNEKTPCPYHPFKWRGFIDFGTGALGDMGCHLIDPVVWSLQLGPPLRVWSEGPAPNGETYPAWEIIHYEFAPTPYTTAGFRMTWYDGGKMPPRELIPLPESEKITKNGSLYIGEKGVILESHAAPPKLLPEKDFKDFKFATVEGDDHYQQWTKACKGICKATADFDYSGPLTETVLLGTIAVRFPGQKLEWDAKHMRFPNMPAANQYVRRPYRKGWEVEHL